MSQSVNLWRETRHLLLGHCKELPLFLQFGCKDSHFPRINPSLSQSFFMQAFPREIPEKSRTVGKKSHRAGFLSQPLGKKQFSGKNVPCTEMFLFLWETKCVGWQSFLKKWNEIVTDSFLPTFVFQNRFATAKIYGLRCVNLPKSLCCVSIISYLCPAVL